MRVEDYRFYGRLCFIFGILLTVIGIVVAVLGIQWYRDFFGVIHYSDPYLGTGAGIIVVGVVLIVLSQILVREYGIRRAETQARPIAPALGYCPYCGTAREEGAVYCEKCGKKLPP